ncbi:hypothetical protein V6R21_16385 [Limibacter armeniacum]|uniref:hypothetical protein n=1 Tax=Limibacter armeniacum TaxID=466084 RepID=UPI002FE66F0E
MRVLLATVFILISLLSFEPSFAQTETKHWYSPNHVKLQYAGNNGWLSTGVGYSFLKKKSWLMDFMYGYVPKSIGGTTIHVLSWKNTFILYRIKINEKVAISPTIGINSIFDISNNSDYNLPDKFAEDYYEFNDAMQFYQFIGATVQLKLKETYFIKQVDFMAETGALVIHMADMFVNGVRPKDIYSVSLSVNAYF